MILCGDKGMKKAVIHTIAAYAIYRISYDFPNFAYSLDIPGSLQRVLAVLLAIGCMFGLIYLYTKYFMKSSLQEINLGKPLPDPKWCVIGIMIPCAVSAFYIFFMPGELKWENLSLQTLIDTVLLSVLCDGFRAGIMEEVTFRGLTLGALEKGLGRWKAILISSFLFASIHLSQVEMQNFLDGVLVVGALMLAGTGLALVTCQTGSVWSSVVIHMLFNLFSGDSQIIHIDVEQNFPALWTYTVDSRNPLLVSIPGSATIDYGLPAIVGFTVLILIAMFFYQKTREDHDGRTDDFDNRG